MSIKLLVADDEEIIRKGVAKYIKLHTDRFDKIYEAENGEEAIDIVLRYQPDIILLDVQMPLKNGIEVMGEINKLGLNPMIVILSAYDEFKYAQQALKYGAMEYLLKPIRATDILACLNRLADERFGKQEQEKRVLENESVPQNSFVKAAQEYIEEHYADNISLSLTAEKIGISSGYLSTIFAQNLKCGFVDYLNMVRIERACCYLEQNYLKTYEIAYKVGFRDEKYFSKVFKKIKGVSPKAYKNMNN